MKLLLGAIIYLSFVSAVVALSMAALEQFTTQQPETTAVAPRSEEPGRQSPVQQDAAKPDRERTPVWIVPTAKYDYTPPPENRNNRIKHTETREAPKAKKRARTRERLTNDARRAMGAVRRTAPAPAVQHGHRDNNPFFRD